MYARERTEQRRRQGARLSAKSPKSIFLKTGLHAASRARTAGRRSRAVQGALELHVGQRSSACSPSKFSLRSLAMVEREGEAAIWVRSAGPAPAFYRKNTSRVRKLMGIAPFERARRNLFKSAEIQKVSPAALTCNGRNER